jgi:hypothetical protein
MKKIASGKTLILGIFCFIVFLIAACGLYYAQNRIFPSGSLVAVYAALGALGALALVFRRYAFAVLFWGGTVLGYASGSYVGGLEGDFAPTAGLIVLVGCIVLFAVLGAVVEAKRIGRGRRKAKEQQEKELAAEDERQRRLMAEQEEKARAAAAARGAPPEAPPEASSGGEKQDQ